MTKAEFVASAKPIQVIINGTALTAEPRVNSTGSVGFYLNGKATIVLPDGTPIRLQVNGNLTAIGSKEWPETQAA